MPIIGGCWPRSGLCNIVHLRARKAVQGVSVGNGEGPFVLKTLSIDQRESGREDEIAPTSWLVRIGSAGAPRKKPELIPLEGIDRIVLGRRDSGDLHAPSSSPKHPGRAEVFDPWMSGEHA